MNQPGVSLTDVQFKEWMDAQKSISSANMNRDRSSSPFGLPRETTGGGIDATKNFVSSLVSGGESLTRATGQTLDSWRRASDIGIGFNNDALGLRASVGQTRLSVEEWESSIRRGQYGFTALAGGMTESTKVFNKLSKDFSDTTAADQLRQLGWTEKEYNEVLALSLARRTSFNIRDEKSRLDAIESTANLAKEMDAVAKLTGKSRQDIIREQEDRNRDVRLQAAIELETRMGGEKAKQSYDKMAQTASALGVENLTRAMYAGRGFTTSERAQMGALMGAGVELQNAINEMKAADKSGNEERRKAAQAQLDAAFAQVNSVQNSDAFLQNLRYNMGQVGDAAVSMKKDSTNYNLTMQAIKEDLKKQGKAYDDTAVQAEAQRRLQLEREGKDLEGRKIAGANLTEVAVKFGARMRDTEAALYKVASTANEAAGKWQSVGQLVKDLANVKIDEVGRRTSSMERGGYLPEELTKISSALEKGNLSAELPNIIKEAGKQAVTEALTQVKNFSVNLDDIGTNVKTFFESMLGKPASPAKTVEPEVKVPSRQDGSLGVTGKFIEDWGKESLVKLHGKEGVITEKQFSELSRSLGKTFNIAPVNVEQALPKNESFNTALIEKQLSGVVNSLQSSLSMELEKNRTSIPTVQNFETMFQKLLDPISQTINQQPVSKQAPPADTVTNSIKDELVQLNTMMSQLVAYTSNVASNTSQQIKATKSLSGNMLT